MENASCRGGHTESGSASRSLERAARERQAGKFIARSEVALPKAPVEIVRVSGGNNDHAAIVADFPLGWVLDGLIPVAHGRGERPPLNPGRAKVVEHLSNVRMMKV
jgi:hypothetical protein